MPQTFTYRKNCIVNDCKINLTKEFALQRLAVYKDSKNKETQKFISLYGEQHLQNIIKWFEIIVNE
jgi:hypothetical protein